MHWLITGCSGFLGRSVAEWVVKQGCRVTGMCRSGMVGVPFPVENIPRGAAELGRRIAGLEPDVVFHAAGSASVGESWVEPDVDFRASVVLWQNLLEAVRLSGVRPRIFFPSSAAVYGNPRVLPVSEGAANAPISPYGFHKVICEQVGREYGELFGLSIVIARLFSVYGALQRRLLVWEVAQQVFSDAEEIRLLGTGREERDYLAVDDVAAALFGIASTAGKLEMQTVNIGSGTALNVINLVEIVQRLAGRSKPVRCGAGERQGDPVRWCANNERLRQYAPGWSPRSIEEGLAECLPFWRSEWENA